MSANDAANDVATIETVSKTSRAMHTAKHPRAVITEYQCSWNANQDQSYEWID